MQFDKKIYCPRNIKIYQLSLNIEIAQFFLCTLEWPYSMIMTMLLSDPFVECMNFAPLTISLHDSRLRYARLSSCKEIVRGAIFMHSPKGSDNNTLSLIVEYGHSKVHKKEKWKIFVIFFALDQIS